jgi:hypothetical protein
MQEDKWQSKGLSLTPEEFWKSQFPLQARNEKEQKEKRKRKLRALKTKGSICDKCTRKIGNWCPIYSFDVSKFVTTACALRGKKK